MGTTLTGTTPQDTYDSLIKVTDNGPLSGTAKYLSDGLGNDSVLALSTARVGVGTTSPAHPLDVVGAAQLSGELYMGNNQFLRFVRSSGSLSLQTLGIPSGTDDVRLLTTGDFNVVTGGLSTLMTVKSTGNVGIGTSSPASLLTLQPANDAADSLRIYRGKDGGFEAQSAIIDAQSGNVNFKSLATDSVRYFSFQLSSNGGSSYTQAARIDLDGLKFGSDTAAANALDDYEEGTWTMGVSFGGASVGVTTTSNTGTYTKIGRQVTVNGYLALSSKGSSTGSARITGLPFTIGAAGSFYCASSLWMNAVTFTNQFVGVGVVNSTTISLEEITVLGAVTLLTDADFANNSEVMVSLTYFV